MAHQNLCIYDQLVLCYKANKYINININISLSPMQCVSLMSPNPHLSLVSTYMLHYAL